MNDPKSTNKVDKIYCERCGKPAITIVIDFNKYIDGQQNTYEIHSRHPLCKSHNRDSKIFKKKVAKVKYNSLYLQTLKDLEAIKIEIKETGLSGRTLRKLKSVYRMTNREIELFSEDKIAMHTIAKMCFVNKIKSPPNNRSYQHELFMTAWQLGFLFSRYRNCNSIFL